jgi:hypothetical protein
VRCSWCVFALLACRHGRPPDAPLPDRTPYLFLFEAGRTWTLPAEQIATAGGATQRTSVTCKVAESKQVGDATVSRIACDPPHAGLLVAGTWVSTPAGLFHPYLPVDDPDELALLGDDDLLIGAIPKEREHSHALDQTQESIEAFGHAGSWCVRQTTSAAADRRAFALCFDGRAVTGGSDLVVGDGVWQQVRFGNAPPEPDEADAQAQ